MTEPRVKPVASAHLTYSDLSQVKEDIDRLFRYMQPKYHRIFKVAPLAHEMAEGEIVLHDDEVSTRRLYAKINGTLRYEDLT